MWTTDESTNEVLTRLLEGQRQVLGGGLVGVYLFGSFATGSFDRGSSDVDTVALLQADLTGPQLGDIERLHADIVRERPEWFDRVEVVYLSTRALAASLGGPAPAARISPGEDFHAIEVDRRWIIDWYQVRSVGISLHGPAAADVMPTITREEYVDAVRGYLLDPDWLESLDEAGDRCYAVLTTCRGLRTIQTGDYVSKREGALWASATMPGYASLIAAALAWKVGSPAERDDSTLPEAEVRHLVVDLQQCVLTA